MVYKQYRMSGSRGVPYGWRCPECGKVSLGVYKVNASSIYDDRGFRVRLDERKAKAEAALTGALDKRTRKAIADAENRRFGSMTFSARCSGCGNQPPWSDVPNRAPDGLATARTVCLVAAVGLFFAGALTSSKNSTLYFQLAGLSAAALALVLLIIFLYRRAAYARVRPDIEKLQPENLPHMAQNGPELLRRLAEDGLISRAEAEALGGAGESESWREGEGTLSETYRRYAEEDARAQRTRRILLGALAVAALGALGVAAVNTLQLERWRGGMEAANLFASNAAAGSKFVVYETRVDGAPRFQKKYLPANRLAATAGEVGYIVEIKDKKEIVGNYGTLTKLAYQIHTTLRLYDCRTGRYIGESIQLTGSNPPSTIKSTQSSGTGGRPAASRITDAVSTLIRRAEQTDDGVVAL